MTARSGEGPQSGLDRLARMHGVLTRYRDQGGRWKNAQPESLEAVLQAMGVDMSGADGVRHAMRHRSEELDSRVLPPTVVVEVGLENTVPELAFTLPARWSGRPVSCVLHGEDGAVREWRASPRRFGHTGDRDRSPWTEGRIPFAHPLPTGYHELRLSVGAEEARTLVLAAPPHAWRPPEEENARHWGIFLPIHALRTERSWGTGDLGDLERLFRWVNSMGGDTVGTLPMLAGAAHSARDAPVYSPISRLFWNEVYVDVEGAPELQYSEDAKTLLESSDFQQRIGSLRSAEEVDWQGAMEAKQAVLELMARDAMEGGVPAWMDSFLQTCPEVQEYARFRALWAERGEPWGKWPEALRTRQARSRAGDDETFRYHLYVQWLLDRQLRRLRDGRGQADAGLYLDLPIGTHPDGFDTWRHGRLFAQGVAVGAPPDEFFGAGQNWRFPPAVPQEMERTGFAYTIAALRNHMRFASRLRLDHVMGLHRLFWIPDGMAPAQGVYIRYPDEALYAVLRIESHRHRTAIVGEDLGTVPREVRRSLARNRIDRMYVAQFEASASEEPALPPPVMRSVFSLNTHDSPTFAGFWKAADIDVRNELGFVDANEADVERAEREELLAALARFLMEQGILEEGGGNDPRRVLEATLRYAASSRAQLLLINLEDLWLEERPQNIPGTGSERPNFRRKARRSLEAIADDEDIAELLRDLDRLRGVGPPSAGLTAFPEHEAMDESARSAWRT